MCDKKIQFQNYILLVFRTPNAGWRIDRSCSVYYISTFCFILQNMLAYCNCIVFCLFLGYRMSDGESNFSLRVISRVDLGTQDAALQRGNCHQVKSFKQLNCRGVTFWENAGFYGLGRWVWTSKIKSYLFSLFNPSKSIIVSVKGICICLSQTYY